MAFTRLKHSYFIWSLVALAVNSRGENNPDNSINFKECYARWSATSLTVGNSRFERTWTLENNRLKPVSLRLKAPDQEWLRPQKSDEKNSDGRLLVKIISGEPSPVEAESLQLEVSVSGQAEIKEDLQIFPNVAGVLIHSHGSNPISFNDLARAKNTLGNGIEEEPRHEMISSGAEAMESLSLIPEHLRLTQVNLMDQTDHHNELASEREWLLHPSEESIYLSGNLIFLEDILSESGLVILKLAPLPDSRPIRTDVDFIVKAKAHSVQIAKTDYPVISLLYSGGRVGRIAAVQSIQRALRTPKAGRDNVFLSNTWGDRSRDARISEAFVRQELDAGARLGVDVVQIDDGWQNGRTRNSSKKGGIWGNWWSDPNFWKIDPARFPNGLEPLIAEARFHGMQLGLWFAPDSSNDAANWQKDAERILELHRLGINYFKIDSLKSPTIAAVTNQKKLFDQVLRESHGQIVLDLDITAGIRPGYFGLMEIGPLFVENRYTDSRNYWPHETLRNLWNLSQYVDPARLRVEFLNNTRNTAKYGIDPLAPANYPADTLFALTMMANPLGWFEVSSLPKNFSEKVSPLIARWKQEWPRLHSGTIIPIGELPDGAKWTGFASIGNPGAGGSILLFRETNKSSEFKLNISNLFPGRCLPTILSGRGTVKRVNEELAVTIPAPYDYVWIQMSSPHDKNVFGASK